MSITAPTYNVKNGNSASVTAFNTTWSAGEVKELTEVVYLANKQEIDYNPSLYLVESTTDILANIDSLINAKTFSHAGMNAATTLMGLFDAISAKLPA